MRPTFGREYIENPSQRIAVGLSDPLTVCLIGGGALSLCDLKGATKDIDLVVANGDAYGQLWAVLMDLGYAEVQSLDADYRALGATSCVENDDGCRLDIFNQQVANKRYTLAVRRVTDGDTASDVLAEFLGLLDGLDVDIEAVYPDREFYVL